MERNTPECYLRIGTTYYKRIEKPDISGTMEEVLKKWSLQILKIDFEKNDIKRIQSFDDAVYFPNHIDYKQYIGSCYNLYSKLKHNPIKGTWESIALFLKHIFGRQFEAGLDYLKLLYLRPLQPLPILCLISQEKETGKTTFVNFLIEIFGANALKINSDNFGSRFNSDWNGKLIIAMEELRLDKVHLKNKIKDLSTSKTYQFEKKGVDRESFPFFGKFVVNSNHVDDLIELDDDDNRFWVIEVKKIEKKDPGLLAKMRFEIPAFLYHLSNSMFTYPEKSRFYFSKDVTWTKALERIVKNSAPPLEKEMALALISALEFTGENGISFVAADLCNLISSNKSEYSELNIRRILKNKWKLSPQLNSLIYKRVSRLNDKSLAIVEGKGRYYTIKIDFLKENFDELMNNPIQIIKPVEKQLIARKKVVIENSSIDLFSSNSLHP